MKRERLGSRLGFILLSAGCAIGIGNVWKFPYMVGENGGAAFVLIYLFFLAILGVPVLTMEFALGRASQKSPVRLYQQLEKKGTKWHIHGYFAFIGNYLLMMFYTTVSAWMLQYFFKTAMGEFEGADTAKVSQIFSDMNADPLTMIVFVGIVVVLGFGVCSLGLEKGIEKITKVMMLALIVLILALGVNSLFLDGGAEGLKFYLLPDFEAMKEVGIVKVIVSAMNQSFFTLSIGIGAMAIFGSYIGKDRALMGEAVTVSVLDTFIAFMAGLIIFPACSSFGVSVDSGPNLIFQTLPPVFDSLPLGRVWGTLFFLFMTFAALSTVFAVFENIISCTMDMTGWSRKKACVINGVAMFVLSIPCALGFNVLSSVHPLGGSTNIMDIEDFIVSNLLLPLGSFIFIMFCVNKRYGWGWDNFVAEANEGKGLKVKKWMRGYMTYVLPLIVLAILIIGLIDYFA